MAKERMGAWEYGGVGGKANHTHYAVIPDRVKRGAGIQHLKAAKGLTKSYAKGLLDFGSEILDNL